MGPNAGPNNKNLKVNLKEIDDNKYHGGACSAYMSKCRHFLTPGCWVEMHVNNLSLKPKNWALRKWESTEKVGRV